MLRADCDRYTVLPSGPIDWDVALGQQVAQVHQRFHAAGHDVHVRNGLADEEIEEGIGLPGRALNRSTG